MDLRLQPHCSFLAEPHSSKRPGPITTVNCCGAKNILSHSSIAEIGLSVFAASLTALRPFLHKLGELPTAKTSRRSGSERSLNESYNFDCFRSPAIRLDDHEVHAGTSRSSSRENIIQSTSRVIHKYIESEVTCGDADGSHKHSQNYGTPTSYHERLE